MAARNGTRILVHPPLAVLTRLVQKADWDALNADVDACREPAFSGQYATEYSLSGPADERYFDRLSCQMNEMPLDVPVGTFDRKLVQPIEYGAYEGLMEIFMAGWNAATAEHERRARRMPVPTTECVVQ